MATFAGALALLRELGDRDTEAITLLQLVSSSGQGLSMGAANSAHGT